MSTKKLDISTRKEPRQARSAGLVEVLLQAAAQVLRDEGAAQFTTSRVAEKAGVSIGSLYQYFPNKAAILFRLQAQEWADTTALLSRVLTDATPAPPERLRRAVMAFVRSECDEAELRLALGDAAPLYRDAPAAKAPRAAGAKTMRSFVDEALPELDASKRRIVADLLAATLSSVGKSISEQHPDEADVYASALAEMLCAFLESVDDVCIASRRE